MSKPKVGDVLYERECFTVPRTGKEPQAGVGQKFAYRWKTHTVITVGRVYFKTEEAPSFVRFRIDTLIKEGSLNPRIRLYRDKEAAEREERESELRTQIRKACAWPSTELEGLEEADLKRVLGIIRKVPVT